MLTIIIILLFRFYHRDEVVENESQDRSVRFVRWIKANDTNSRRRESVKQATLRILTIKSDLSESLAGVDNSSAPPQQQTTGWQCLDDAHGIELCPVGSQGEYEEMGGLEGAMRQHSDLLCSV
jgi:hypothetical protein